MNRDKVVNPSTTTNSNKGLNKMETAYQMNDNGWNEEMGAEFTNDAHEETYNHDAADEATEAREEQQEAATINEGTFSEEEKDTDAEDNPVTADDLVETINDVYENGLGNAKMRIGTLVLQYCFDGDADKARSKNPKKETSYKDVCEHKDLKVDVKELGRCVRAAAQLVEYEQEGVDHSKLSFHALLEIAKLPEKAERLKLGRKANEKSWTVREIRKVVDDRKQAEARKAITGEDAFRLLKQLKGILTNEKLRNFLSSEDSLQSDLESEHRIELSKIANHMARQMETWSPMLDNTRKTVTKIEFAGEEAVA
jgi:hypothetical protein